MEIRVDARRNLLLFSLGGEHEGIDQRVVVATIDVGEGGRLIGIEIPATPNVSFAAWTEAGLGDEDEAGFYLPIAASESPADAHARSATATITLRLVGGVVQAIELPRLGTGYEITYPSGNQ